MSDSEYWRRPHGYTLFCDDVRSEIGNKQTIVGLYNRVMYVQDQFPQLLPKLGFLIYYGEPADEESAEITAKLIYEAGGNEQVIFEANVTSEQRRAGIRASEPGSDVQIASVTFAGLVSPFLLTGVSSIKSRVYRKGEEVRVGRLQIRIGAPELVAAGAN